jgi:hypothetical protein
MPFATRELHRQLLPVYESNSLTTASLRFAASRHANGFTAELSERYLFILRRRGTSAIDRATAGTSPEKSPGKRRVPCSRRQVDGRVRSLSAAERDEAKSNTCAPARAKGRDAAAGETQMGRDLLGSECGSKTVRWRRQPYCTHTLHSLRPVAQPPSLLPEPDDEQTGAKSSSSGHWSIANISLRFSEDEARRRTRSHRRALAARRGDERTYARARHQR